MTSLSLLITEATRSLLAPATGGHASEWLRPKIAAVYLTSYCNSRCSMCDFWKNERDPRELTSVQWGIVFSRLRAFGVRYVGVNASGEMFTRSDVFDILQHLHDLQMDFGINTNSTLITKRKADRLASLQPKVITIGLDGVGDENYVQTRGLKNGFSKVTRRIEYLQSAGIKNIRIGSVMMRENLHDWVNLAEFALETDLEGIRFTPYHDAYFHTEKTPALSPYKDPVFIGKVKEEIGRLLELKKRTGIVKNSRAYLQRVPDFMLDQGNYFPAPCLQGTNRIELDIYANVTLCSFVTEPLGNLLETDMDEIWRSETHRQARRDAFLGECPHCFLSCYGEENLRLSTKSFFSTMGESVRRAGRLIEKA